MALPCDALKYGLDLSILTNKDRVLLGELTIMFKYLFFLVLCHQMSYGMQPQVDNQFYVKELVGQFDATKPSTSTDTVHFINTVCLCLRKDIADLHIPPHIANNETTKSIATHLLLQAVSSETSHTKDYVTLLLSLGASPLGTQKITMIQTGKAQHIGGLQDDTTLYNVIEIYTTPCETPLRLAIQYRNVPAVETMLEQQPTLASQQHSDASPRTYTDYSAWLVENPDRKKAESLHIRELMKRALENSTSKPTEGNE